MTASRPRLPWTVVALGVTSLFADVGSEMVFPLLPVFLTDVLKAGPGFLGIVEGAADTVSGLLKLVAGHLSDRLRTRKPLVVFGYGLAGAARPLIALTMAPWQVLAIRVTDRVGKGIRSAPRDALIADAAGPDSAGRAFGFHRAMDHAGAVIGPLVASALIAFGLEVRTIFLLAAIPGVLSVLMVLTVRDRGFPVAASTASPTVSRVPLPAEAKRYFWILLLFSIGNSSDVFLLLRLRDLGIDAALLPALWSGLHVVKLVSSWLGGGAADRVPRRHLIAAGWVVFAAVYLGMGILESPAGSVALFLVYGTYYGLTEPAEKALVRDLVPPEIRGQAFGWYNFVIGVTALPAGLLTGALWHFAGSGYALGMGAAVAGLAAMLLLTMRRGS